MSQRKEGFGFVLGLLVGAAVGASIAVILAPQSGSEARDGLMSRAHEVKGRAQELVGEFKDDAGEWVEKGKQVMGRALGHKDAGPQSHKRYGEG